MTTQMMAMFCQGAGLPCTADLTCCGTMPCEKTRGGGWDMACTAPPCVQEGGVLNGGDKCCGGSMPYHANGGSYCKAVAPQCVPEGGVLSDGDTCCAGAMPYHANGGSYCKGL